MDKLLLDTNYLLDVAVEARPRADAAAQLFELFSDGGALGIISASALKDFYHIARRGMDDQTRREWIALFLDAFVIAELNRGICSAARVSTEPDFEDAIMGETARAEACTVIISRDEQAFKATGIPKMTAEEYLLARR